MQPATRAALYGLKATVGSLPTKGTSPWSPLTDSVGAMAKDSSDMIAMFSVLMKERDFSASSNKSWGGLRVGFVDFLLWEFSPVVCNREESILKQSRKEMEEAVLVIENEGAEVVRNVPLTSMDELVLDGKDALEQLWSELYC